MTSSSLDLLKCSPSELIEFLLPRRFQNDQKALATFLLEGISLLPEAQQISDELNDGDDNDAEEVVDVCPVEDDDGDEKAEEAVLGKTITQEEEETEEAALKKLVGDPIVGVSSSPNPGPFQVEISMSNPRAKLTFAFHQTGIVCCSSSASSSSSTSPQALIIPARSVQHFLIFPKPQDCYTTSNNKKKKPTNDMVLLSFHKHQQENPTKTATTMPILQFKQKQLSQICFPMPNNSVYYNNVTCATANDKGQNSSNYDSQNDKWVQLFCDSLHFDSSNIIQVINNNHSSPKNNTNNQNKTKKWRFSSYHDPNQSTTSGALPFVKCYHGVNDGVLYPLKEGILFFKPPLYLPRSNLNSISCGRGSDNSSRYVDLIISTDDDDRPYEFNNIYREEVKVLNNYIHHVLIPEMKKDQQQQEQTRDRSNDDDDDNDQTSTNTAAVVQQEEQDIDNDDEDDDDEDDEDYEDNSHQDSVDSDDDDDDSDIDDGGIPFVDEEDIDNGSGMDNEDDDATVTDEEEESNGDSIDDGEDNVASSPASLKTKRQKHSSQGRSKQRQKNNNHPSKRQKRAA